MIFEVKRTSSYDDKPCEEAFKTMFPVWETRTCTEEYFNKQFSHREGLWRKKGKNHNITAEGFIIRQKADVEQWAIEISAIDELIKFSEKYGSLVFNCDGIEIYDDYRE